MPREEAPFLKSGGLDAVRTFSGRGPRLESLLAAIGRQAGGWEMTERPKLSDPARATLAAHGDTPATP